MKGSVAAVCLAALAGLAISCDWTSPTEPERPTPTPMVRPTPTATPTPPVYPPGVPNATAFENLQHVMRLEAESPQPGGLMSVDGGCELNGRIIIGSGWQYSFLRGNNEVEAIWVVWSDGRVQFYTYQPPIHAQIPGIDNSLRVDSPAAIQRALEVGVSAFAAIHPDAIVRVHYWGNLVPVACDMQFFDRTHVDRCEPQVIIDAATGELVYKALDCIGASQRRR
jgi:hypothetical protein